MGFDVKTRPSNSPYVDTVMHGRTVGNGSVSRPMDCHSHLTLVNVFGATRVVLTGAHTSTADLPFIEGVEITWIRLKLGTYLPRLPVADYLNKEITLPAGAGRKFWLDGEAWEYPTFENADTFVSQLVCAGVLARDPVVDAMLCPEARPETLAERTVRYRFARATGLTRGHIRQVTRAQHAQALLASGASILDTVAELGYSDQPHMTRSLKTIIGQTPAEIVKLRAAAVAAMANNTR
jgi:AraC-like DNA-binding protein